MTTPTPTPADRLALAVCPFGPKCKKSCSLCRRQSQTITDELAQILRERHGGSSSVADWLDGIGGSHG
jgi:hypothetical protein